MFISWHIKPESRHKCIQIIMAFFRLEVASHSVLWMPEKDALFADENERRTNKLQKKKKAAKMVVLMLMMKLKWKKKRNRQKSSSRKYYQEYGVFLLVRRRRRRCCCVSLSNVCKVSLFSQLAPLPSWSTTCPFSHTSWFTLNAALISAYHSVNVQVHQKQINNKIEGNRLANADKLQ